MIDETFILIPGRTSRQGTSLNEGKFSADLYDSLLRIDEVRGTGRLYLSQKQ